MIMSKERICAFDVLKAVAIILVVVYHMGIVPSGYLGVDIFLVINGYFLARYFQKLQTTGDVFNFIVARVTRLWPIVIVASVFCLVWGAIWLLPFTYRDLVREIIASNLFCNNILSYLTTADYWDVSNDYKPLMHMWYLGILVQFYVLFSIFVVLIKKVLPAGRDWTFAIVTLCGIVSLGVYVLTDVSASIKFYFVPFRMFEFCFGMMIALYFSNRRPVFSERLSTWLVFIAYTFLFCVIFSGGFASNETNVVITCVLTSILLGYLPFIGESARIFFHNEHFSFIGKMSLSIYIWHQIVLSFYRGVIEAELDMTHIVSIVALVALFSFLSYYYFENKIQTKYLPKTAGLKNLLICICVALPVCLTSCYLYRQAGVLRSVPELGVEKGKVTPRMHIDYNENIHQYNRNFCSSGKIRWIVIGDSFGRDWCNILREAGVENEVELSYSTGYNAERMKNADVIFKTMGTVPELYQSTVDEFLDEIRRLGIPEEKVIIVGGKKFGWINPVYVSRFYSKYPDIAKMSKIQDKYFYYNDKLRNKYDGVFIDLLMPVSRDGCVRVFTDDAKYISHDCVHLTEYGAKYYAKLLKPKIEKLVKQSKSIAELRMNAK